MEWFRLSVITVLAVFAAAGVYTVLEWVLLSNFWITASVVSAAIFGGIVAFSRWMMK